MKNRTGRKLLEQKYGEGCFMERAGIRIITEEQEKQLRKIKGYKRLDRQITYHHIKEKHLGGEVSIENGANLASYNHTWLHQQPEEVKEKINEQLQKFKLSIDMAQISATSKGVKGENLGNFVVDMSDVITIPVYDNTEQDMIKRKEKFNRAKIKNETQKLINEELYR
ncbi:MAG: hypothetical protein ACLTPN_02575 [Clostridia bacterium]|jgi:hypothetical protein